MTLINGAEGLINGNVTTALIIDTGSNTIVNNGVIEATESGGVTVKSAVTGAGSAKVSAGTLFFASSFSENVAFTGTTGVLELANSRTYTGKISGFSLTGGTSLDLNDITFVTGSTEASFSGTTTSGTLTVTNGTQTATITLLGNYKGSAFTVAADNHGGTTVVDPTNPPAAALPLAGPASSHQFVAAMASLGGTAGSAIQTREVWAVPEPMLVRPRTMNA